MNKETYHLLFFIPVIPLIAGIFCLLSSLDRDPGQIRVPVNILPSSYAESTVSETGIEPFRQITFYELPETQTTQTTPPGETEGEAQFSEPVTENRSDREQEIAEEPAGKISGEDVESGRSSGKSLGTFTCVAYCGCSKCSDGFGNITAIGTVCRPNHTIAVDPGVIPYGTWVEINGNTYVAEDCGGGIQGNTIDIYFENHAETIEFGIRFYEVFLA